MKILVIPDSHLKPFIFMKADEILKSQKADRAVCLMDIPDDWGKIWSLEAYDEMYWTVLSFARKHPDTYWCLGNHDCSYLWKQMESGYSVAAAYLVKEKTEELIHTAGEDHVSYVRRIDSLVFSHGGLAKNFMNDYFSQEEQRKIDHCIEKINAMGMEDMWIQDSPIWARLQQGYDTPAFTTRGMTQVVGHTPVEEVQEYDRVITTDVFSTYRDGSPIGNQKFIIIDSETAEWEYA